MPEIDAYLKTARARAFSASPPQSPLQPQNPSQPAESLAYWGALTPQESYDYLLHHHNVRLVDVRTRAERDWVGKVLLPEAQHLWVEWSSYPGAVPNAQFVMQLQTQLQQQSQAPLPSFFHTPLLFLCRSGVRSRHAAKAATEAGFTYCLDILQGFEGDKNAQGQRKTVGGWCAADLPWVGA